MNHFRFSLIESSFPVFLRYYIFVWFIGGKIFIIFILSFTQKKVHFIHNWIWHFFSYVWTMDVNYGCELWDCELWVCLRVKSLTWLVSFKIITVSVGYLMSSLSHICYLYMNPYITVPYITVYSLWEEQWMNIRKFRSEKLVRVSRHLI